MHKSSFQSGLRKSSYRFAGLRIRQAVHCRGLQHQRQVFPTIVKSNSTKPHKLNVQSHDSTNGPHTYNRKHCDDNRPADCRLTGKRDQIKNIDCKHNFRSRSGHLLANMRIRRPSPQTIKVRNMQAIDPLRLQADFQAKDWGPFYAAEDASTKAEFLTSELKPLLQHHAPERTLVVRDKQTPWITEEIKRAIEIRNLAYTLYSRNPNRIRGDNQWLDYTMKRDRANSLIYTAKKRYAEMHFNHTLPAKKLWSNLRREGVHNNPKKGTPAENINPDELNVFFSEGHRQLQNGTRFDTLTEPPHRTAVDRGEPRFDFRHTNVEEICHKIYEIDTNATGSDGISISFIKLLCPYILPTLCHLFNSIIDSKSFPPCWKKAIITPIPKVCNPTQLKDFRPISVLPAISKILEKILLGQITEHINNPTSPLLARFQSGYRKGYSTTTALGKVVHDIYDGFSRNHCTVMVLVDFSLAFNCVNHRILKAKLRDEFRFSQAACSLISSFLERRRQSVRMHDGMSEERDVVDGTPQGSCLSALLFSMYINSLPSSLTCSHHLYADDLQIYISGPASDIGALVQSINEDLEAINNWASINRLSPNPKKTQAIIFSKAGTVTPTTAITFCGEIVPLSTNVTNLGLQLDNNLSWTHQVNDVVRKTYNILRTFRRFAPVLSLPTRKKLVQAVIVPVFTYADVVYYPGLAASLKEQLHRCYKSAVRFVFNLRRRDSTAAVRNSILGHDLPFNYQLRICAFMRQAYYNEQPEYILQHLQRGQLERTRCFIIPRHTTSSGKSLLVYGATCWNGLSLELKQKPTISSFKTAMKNLV